MILLTFIYSIIYISLVILLMVFNMLPPTLLSFDRRVVGWHRLRLLVLLNGVHIGRVVRNWR